MRNSTSPFPHLLAFLEVHVDDLAVDARLDRDGRERLDVADRGDAHRHRLLGNADDDDRDGSGGAALGRPAGGRTGDEVGDDRGDRDHRDREADQPPAAAGDRSGRCSSVFGHERRSAPARLRGFVHKARRRRIVRVEPTCPLWRVHSISATAPVQKPRSGQRPPGGRPRVLRERDAKPWQQCARIMEPGAVAWAESAGEAPATGLPLCNAPHRYGAGAPSPATSRSISTASATASLLK